MRMCFSSAAIVLLLAFLSKIEIGYTCDAEDRVARQSEIHTSSNAAPMWPVDIQGTRFWMIVDTGSQVTAVFRNTAPIGFLGKPSRIDTQTNSYGVLSIETYQNTRIQPENCQQAVVELAAVDPRDFNEYMESPCSGVLGMDYLHKHTLELYIHRNLVRLDSDTLKVTKLHGMKPFPLRTDSISRHPFVQIEVPGNPEVVECLIDAGDQLELRLTRATLSSLVRSGRAKEYSSSILKTAYGVLITNKYIVRELQIFGTTLRNVPCSEDPSRNVVGWELLRRFHVLFDFPKDLIWACAEPTVDPNHWIDRVNLSGVRIRRTKAGKYLLGPVRPKSVGEEAGLKIDDEIIALNGQSMEELRLRKASDMMCEAGKILVVRAKRGTEIFDVSLKLQLPGKYPPDWPKLAPTLPDLP